MLRWWRWKMKKKGKKIVEKDCCIEREFECRVSVLGSTKFKN
jgi:hypothetical protein